MYISQKPDIEVFNEYLGNILDKVAHEKKSWVTII